MAINCQWFRVWMAIYIYFDVPRKRPNECFSTSANWSNQHIKFKISWLRHQGAKNNILLPSKPGTIAIYCHLNPEPVAIYCHLNPEPVAIFCLTYSYNIIPVLTAAFRLSVFPNIGIFTL